MTAREVNALIERHQQRTDLPVGIGLVLAFMSVAILGLTGAL
jgi:hypothetical protein